MNGDTTRLRREAAEFNKGMKQTVHKPSLGAPGDWRTREGDARHGRAV
jgi:hypothetical protein